MRDKAWWSNKWRILLIWPNFNMHDETILLTCSSNFQYESIVTPKSLAENTGRRDLTLKKVQLKSFRRICSVTGVSQIIGI